MTKPVPASGKLSLAGNLLIVFGAIFLVIGIVSLRDERAARNWPTVEGTVESSRVRKEAIHRVDTAGQRETRTQFRAEVAYDYVVDGVPLKGTRVSALDRRSSRPESAEAVVGRYPSGSRVWVHYDPEQPANALLEIDARGAAYRPLGFAAFLVLGGLLLRLSERLTARRAKRSSESS